NSMLRRPAPSAGAQRVEGSDSDVARFLPARLTAIGGGSEGNPGAAVVATLRSRAIPKGCHIHGECSRSARIEFQQPAVERHLELPAAYASHKAVERGGVVR